MNSASNSQRRKKDPKPSHLNKSFLLDIIDEALYRQNLALQGLDNEIKKQARAENISDNCEKGEDSKKDGKERLITDRVMRRKNELGDTTTKLKGLRSEVERTSSSQQKFEEIKVRIEKMGYEAIFRQPRTSWKSTQARDQEFGRPQGFNGEVYYSPLGVPILVGRMNAHKDDVMRNAAQGSDLWFQVEDYNGSRVLLRTSLMRGTKGSKQCLQMAADLAAKYSIWGEDYDSIPVMYTDSRKVAKRGSKVGQMKQKKSLGRMMGMPSNV